MPHESPRERALARAAGLGCCLGAALFLVLFPFVYGDPAEGEDKVSPGWTTPVGWVAMALFVIAMACLVVRAVVRARLRRP